MPAADVPARRLQRRRESGRTGQAHDGPVGLPDQSAHPQAGGGNFRVDQDGGWIATQPLPRTATNPSVGLLRGEHVQSAAIGAAGPGPRELTGAAAVTPPAKQRQRADKPSENTDAERGPKMRLPQVRVVETQSSKCRRRKKDPLFNRLLGSQSSRAKQLASVRGS